MFPNRYWSNYSADRYWPPIGADTPAPPSGTGGGGWSPPGHHGHGKRHYPRRIMLPNRRVVEPKSYADYQRIVGEILAGAAPDAVDVTQRPVAKRKSSRSIGKTEPEYSIDAAALAAVERLMQISDLLSMEALIAELTGKVLVQMITVDDEAAMIAILTELA